MDAVQTGLEAILRIREGEVLRVYRDSRGFNTAGIGHLVTPADALKFGDPVSQAQVDAWFATDTAKAIAEARVLAAQMGVTTNAMIVSLADVCFQLGTAWTAKFPHTWKLICARQYDDAIEALQESAWAQQTPVRVQDFVDALAALES